MKIISGFALLAAALWLTGCKSPQPAPSVHTDHSMAGPSIDMIPDNLIEDSADRSHLIWLGAVRERLGPWEASYYLDVRYEGAPDAGFMDILPGPSLILTVDGQTMRFVGPGSETTREKTSQGNFKETAIYTCTATDIRKIAKAKSVKMEVIGSRLKLERQLAPENINRFRDFVLTLMGL